MIAIALALIALAAWFVLRERAVVSFGYVVADQFSSMPKDDAAFIDWLKQQPGVVEHTVHVSRRDSALHVSFLQVRNVAGRPPVPAVDDGAQIHGYEGGGGFKDVGDDTAFSQTD